MGQRRPGAGSLRGRRRLRLGILEGGDSLVSTEFPIDIGKQFGYRSVITTVVN